MSWLVRENPFYRKLVANVPLGPTEGSTANPKDAFGLALTLLKLSIEVGKTRGVPGASQQFPNCAPEELGHGANEEHMISVLMFITQRASPIRWAMSLLDVAISG